MIRLMRRISAVGLVACLAGCSGDTSPPPPLPSPPLARASTVNGTYNGLMQVVSGAPISCGSSDMFRVTVQNRTFRYVLNQPQVPWQTQRVFTATIAPDGSFRSGSDAAYIAGTASQGHMQGQIVGDACQFQFEADSDGSF